MAMNTPTIAEVRSIIYEQLNLSKDVSFGAFDNSPLYKTSMIDAAIRAADDEIVNLIIKTPGHPRKSEYDVNIVINTAGIPVKVFNSDEHSGDFTHCDISTNFGDRVEGKPAPASRISEWSKDPNLYGGVDCIDGYYNFEEGYFIFTGLSATLNVCRQPFHDGSGGDTSCFAPIEYKMAIVRRAMRELLKKDPGRTAMYNQYDAEVKEDIQLITNGASVVPAAEFRNQTR